MIVKKSKLPKSLGNDLWEFSNFGSPSGERLVVQYELLLALSPICSFWTIIVEVVGMRVQNPEAATKDVLQKICS